MKTARRGREQVAWILIVRLIDHSSPSRWPLKQCHHWITANTADICTRIGLACIDYIGVDQQQHPNKFQDHICPQPLGALSKCIVVGRRWMDGSLLDRYSIQLSRCGCCCCCCSFICLFVHLINWNKIGTVQPCPLEIDQVVTENNARATNG